MGMIIAIADLVISDGLDGEGTIGLFGGPPGMVIHFMRGDCNAYRRCTDTRFPPHLRH